MTNSTAHLTRSVMPITAPEALAHLVDRHGWEPRPVDETLVSAHRFAHGGGRHDVSDHAHSSAAASRQISGAGQDRRWVVPVVVAVGLFVGFAVVAGHTSQPSGGGSFSVAAGWTVDRASSLSVKIQTDDGVSSTRADCAMKIIAYDTPWLDWQAMGSSGQLVAIRAAEAAC